jgi:hypothetical protein
MSKNFLHEQVSIARPSNKNWLEGFNPDGICWINDIKPSSTYVAQYIAEEAPSSSDADQKRWCGEFERDALSAIDRLIAHRTLGVSLGEGVDQVAVLARNLFEAISPTELNGPSISDIELIFRALTVVRSLTWMVRGWAIQNGRQDLILLDNVLTETVGAVMECDEGFDEPKLRARPRSSWLRSSTIFWWKVLGSALMKRHKEWRSTSTITT